MGFGAGLRGVTRGRSRGFSLHGGRFFVEFVVGFDAAVKIGGTIAGDRGEPSWEARDFAEGAHARQGLQEDVVDQIVDVWEGHAGEENAVNHSGVAGVEEAECCPVASLGGAHERVVGATAGFLRRIHGRRTGAGRAEFKECGHFRSTEIRNVSPGRRGRTAEC